MRCLRAHEGPLRLLPCLPLVVTFCGLLCSQVAPGWLLAFGITLGASAAWWWLCGVGREDKRAQEEAARCALRQAAEAMRAVERRSARHACGLTYGERTEWLGIIAMSWEPAELEALDERTARLLSEHGGQP